MSLIKVRCDSCTFPFTIKSNITIDFDCPLCGSNRIYIEQPPNTKQIEIKEASGNQKQTD